MRTPNLASRSHRRRMSAAARDHTEAGWAHPPPCWQDGTARPLHRPTDPEDPQDYDRGQKQRHTVKTLRVIAESGPLGFVSATDDGTRHETSLAALTGDTWPPGSCLYQERGCHGCVLAGGTMVHPKKQPRGGDRTPRAQAINRRISSRRIRLEPAMGGVKRARMVTDNIRLVKDGIRDSILDTCAGWQNVRLPYRLWHDAHNKY